MDLRVLVLLYSIYSYLCICYFIPVSPPRLFQYYLQLDTTSVTQWQNMYVMHVVSLPISKILIWTFLILIYCLVQNPTSTHIAIGNLSDCSLTGRIQMYVIPTDPLTLLLVISLTVPWLAESRGMWSPLIHSHCYWWSLWLFLDWQNPNVCDLCWSMDHFAHF